MDVLSWASDINNNIHRMTTSDRMGRLCENLNYQGTTYNKITMSGVTILGGGGSHSTSDINNNIHRMTTYDIIKPINPCL